MNGIDLSIVTVNWKVADLVAEMLYSIADKTKRITCEIFIVDNASGDGMNKIVDEFYLRYPSMKIRFIRNDKNLGFATANNIAIRQAIGRYVLLLNPDTYLANDVLSDMVEWLDAHPDISIAGPKLLNRDGSLQPSVRAFPGTLDQALILLKLHHVARNLFPLRRYFADDFDYKKTADVDQLMGAALFVRRGVFSKIGLLDENFFIWFEEVDFCYRAKLAGLRVTYVPMFEIIHYGGEAFSRAFTLSKQRYFNASLRTYFRKHHPRRAWVLVVPRALGIFLAFLISIFRKK